MINKNDWKYGLDIEHEDKRKTDIKEAQKFIFAHYGFNNQLSQLEEEIVELLLAIKKHKRFNGSFTLADIGAEMADVLNLIEQFASYNGSLSECILTTKEYKINRELNRISERLQAIGLEEESKALDCTFEL